MRNDEVDKAVYHLKKACRLISENVELKVLLIQAILLLDFNEKDKVNNTNDL